MGEGFTNQTVPLIPKCFLDIEVLCPIRIPDQGRDTKYHGWTLSWIMPLDKTRCIQIWVCDDLKGNLLAIILSMAPSVMQISPLEVDHSYIWWQILGSFLELPRLCKAQIWQQLAFSKTWWAVAIQAVENKLADLSYLSMIALCSLFVYRLICAVAAWDSRASKKLNKYDWEFHQNNNPS
jgi:hypothetical protein